MARTLQAALSLLLILLVAVSDVLIPSVSGGGGEYEFGQLGWIGGGGSSACTIGECASESEFDLGSESSRRILATTRYISYDALKRDSIPCNRRGASYYNCRPGAQANPYQRGCSAITRCRS